MNTKPLFHTILAAAVALALPAFALADGPRGDGFHGSVRAQPNAHGHPESFRDRADFHRSHGDYPGRYYSGRYYHHGHYYGYRGYPYWGLNIYDGPVYYYNDDDAPAYYQGSAVDDGDVTARDVQAALRSRGYYHGAIDGDIGPASRAAIRAFQASRGLPITGVINDRLLRSLGLT
ncbi:MAG: peptidoglycan-binding domain-containing protein [Chthoniobacteraceae bacterium]